MLRSKLLLLIVSISALNALSSYAEDATKYLCITEKATGFSFTGDEWVSTDFNVDSEKFVIRPLTEVEKVFANAVFEAHIDKGYGSKKPTHGVVDLGKNTSTASCVIERTTDAQFFRCQGSWGASHYNFTPVTGRFIATSMNGYVTGDTGFGADTPYISIGRCSRI